jgi:hypothetical protein
VLSADTPDAELGTVADVARFLAATINQTRRGALDAKVANCLGLLCGQLMRAIGVGELERRLEALEARLAAQAAGANGRRFA